jgi:hypothetical protein
MYIIYCWLLHDPRCTNCVFLDESYFAHFYGALVAADSASAFAAAILALT